MKTNLDIYSYNHFSKLLLDRYNELKFSNSEISYRKIAMAAGIKSQAFVHDVFQGKKSVSPDLLEKITAALQMNKVAQEYTVHLCRLNQAKTLAEQEHQARIISKLRGFRRRFPLTEAHVNFYRRWYYAVLFETLGLKAFRSDPEWIASKIPGVSMEEVREAVGDLKTLGLIEENSYGRLSRASPEVVTEETVTSHLALAFHRDIMELAVKSLEKTDSSKREMLSLVFAMNSSQFDVFRDLLRKFYSDAYALASAESEANIVYHMGFQLFPLTEET